MLFMDLVKSFVKVKEVDLKLSEQGQEVFARVLHAVQVVEEVDDGKQFNACLVLLGDLVLD